MKNMEKSKLQYLEEFNITCTESSNSPLLSICHWNIKQQWIWKRKKKIVNSTQNWKLKKGNSDNKIFWKRDNRREGKNSQILANNKEAMKSI